MSVYIYRAWAVSWVLPVRLHLRPLLLQGSAASSNSSSSAELGEARISRPLLTL